MKLTGTIINYYFHCKRQCWLFFNRINLEDNSEDVRIGRILHEIRAKDSTNKELSIGNVKIDKLTKDYLVEVKKSDADIESVKWQVFLYLKILKDKGIIRKGKIEFIENNKSDRKTIFVELDDQIENKLVNIESDILSLVKDDVPKEKFKNGCKKCAYYEYCFI
ncbi:MAG: CRISPR-associated protein Cas4 [Peptostreptococcaceae bacterium]